MEIVKMLRKARNMTQAELAALCGVTQGCVNQWESGKTHPRFNVVAKLALALGCSVDELVRKAG